MRVGGQSRKGREKRKPENEKEEKSSKKLAHPKKKERKKGRSEPTILIHKPTGKNGP